MSSWSRQETLINAIRASLTGQVSLCERVFTADVTCTSPTMSASSRDELETLLSSRADSLSDLFIRHHHPPGATLNDRDIHDLIDFLKTL